MLYRLALSLPQPAEILVVGSFIGASACFLAAAASEHNRGVVHCVDTWTNEAMSEAPRDAFSEFLSNTQQYRAWLIPHRGRSQEVAVAFDRKLDLLFIDGDHSYKGCKADAELWLPKLKPGGIVAFHDYGWSHDVQRVVGELVIPIARQQRAPPNLFVGTLK